MNMKRGLESKHGLHAGRVAAAALTAILSVASIASHAADQHSGRATGVQAAVGVSGVIGTSQSIGDTGPLPPEGGKKAGQALPVNLKTKPLTLTANVNQLETRGYGLETQSTAEISNVALDVANLLGTSVLSLKASVVKADAALTCAGTDPVSVSAGSQIAGLEVNGKLIDVTGAPNQTLSLGVAKIVLNEQTKQPSAASVNAIHVMVAGLADVVISHADAGIKCPYLAIQPIEEKPVIEQPGKETKRPKITVTKPTKTTEPKSTKITVPKPEPETSERPGMASKTSSGGASSRVEAESQQPKIKVPSSGGHSGSSTKEETRTTPGTRPTGTAGAGGASGTEQHKVPNQVGIKEDKPERLPINKPVSLKEPEEDDDDDDGGHEEPVIK